MPESHLRAADADRTAVASVLGEHMAAGRLTVEEYDDRLARAYAAKTYGELEVLTADLPSTAPVRAPSAGAVATGTGSQAVRPHRGPHPAAWQAWLRTSLIVLTIWAVTCLASWQLLYFWPVWVIGPWGAVMLAQTIGGGRRDRSRDRHRRR
jgi:hypothetical protein